MFKESIFRNEYSVYEAFDELSPDLSNILTKYRSISGDIINYKTKINEMNKNKNSDFSANLLEYTNPNRTLMDGAQDDVQIMLVNQYNMYMAGLITMSTIIVFAILLARE